MSRAWCVICGVFGSSVLVQVIESGSGPGGMLFACPEHARELARRRDAPDWLKNDIARLDGHQIPS